jgi:hypothetical protein
MPIILGVLAQAEAKHTTTRSTGTGTCSAPRLGLASPLGVVEGLHQRTQADEKGGGASRDDGRLNRL